MRLQSRVRSFLVWPFLSNVSMNRPTNHLTCIRSNWIVYSGTIEALVTQWMGCRPVSIHAGMRCTRTHKKDKHYFKQNASSPQCALTEALQKMLSVDSTVGARSGGAFDLSRYQYDAFNWYRSVPSGWFRWDITFIPSVPETCSWATSVPEVKSYISDCRLLTKVGFFNRSTPAFLCIAHFSANWA